DDAAWGHLSRGALPEEALFEERLRPRTLAEMIGQDRLRENLAVFIRAARARGEALDHILFHGPPGLGKTSLAGAVANELGAPLRTTSGPPTERPRGGAPRRPPGTALEPRGRRRAFHRRDPPPRARDRGDPLSRDGGLSARSPDRRGDRRALDAPRPAALHARGRDDASGSAHL